ncbi:hypothetical protein GCM10008964_06890 [Methylophaga marina]|uniref:Uncharacterized protein n=2 Tax=Methylophaga marina TaxID=45495 RepID=A0ABP3CXN8_9GAMM
MLSTLIFLASGQAMADWENLPATGVSVGSDTSAYILCNPTGNFGSGSASGAPVQPTSVTEACALLPATDAAVPDSNFTGLNRIPIGSKTRSIYMNNSYTNYTDINIGVMREYVWRRPTNDGYECIYGMKVTMNFNDYDLNQPYSQFFEINDLARKGWSGKTVNVAYSTVPTSADPTYRIGRTFTSIQHSAGVSYIAQPPVGLDSSPAITSTQKADLNSDWIVFTTRADVVSGMQYVRTECSANDLTTASDAIRLRQTSRDGQPPIEIEVEGFLPN